jgi:hypothetical protein
MGEGIIFQKGIITWDNVCALIERFIDMICRFLQINSNGIVFFTISRESFFKSLRIKFSKSFFEWTSIVQSLNSKD